MNGRFTSVVLAGLLGWLVAGSSPSWAQGPVTQATESAPLTATVSQFLQARGYTLSADEMAFLDADEGIQNVYMQVLVNVDYLARTDPASWSDEWHRAIATGLTLVASLDPGAAPTAPPGMATLRELAVAQREHYRQAARAWLDAYLADDPQWAQRGAEAQLAGLQVLYNWQAELIGRYPRAQGQ